jgi:phage repressor protein C with HTH and peptisase S24 domain
MDMPPDVAFLGSSGTLLAVTGPDTPASADAVARLATRWVVARVIGPSMAPTLRHGDRLLVRRLASGAPVAAGVVVLARFPTRPELLVVKRVRRPAPGGVWVEGDNSLVADDSRAYGPAVAVGRVVVRLWPRAGRLPAAPEVPG